jgi:hypothetical protein
MLPENYVKNAESFRKSRKWDGYYLYFLLAWFIVGCIFGGCAIFDRPDPDDAEAIACIMQGGDWVDGECVYPPDPDPDPDPDPEPEPTPTPECDFPQGIPDREFTKLPVSSKHAKVVNEVIAEITGCSVGSRCMHGKSPQEFMQLVVAALRERGIVDADGKPTEENFCAGQHITGHTDEIAVSVDCRAVWEGYHITTYGPRPTVVWSPGSRRPAYQIPPSYCVDNTDPPPPVQPDCPDPIPDKSRLSFKINCGPRGNCDATAVVTRSCKFCADIGLGEYEGKIRCGCPVRPDGHPERSACEQFVVGGDPRWFCDDQEIESKANPYKARCNGVVRLCNSDLTVCS